MYVGSYTTWGEEIVTLPMVRVVLRNTEYEEDKAHKGKQSKQYGKQ